MDQGQEADAADEAGLRDRLAMTERPQKITVAKMRESGVRGLLVHCADYRLQPLDRDQRRCPVPPPRGRFMAMKRAADLDWSRATLLFTLDQSFFD